MRTRRAVVALAAAALLPVSACGGVEELPRVQAPTIPAPAPAYRETTSAPALGVPANACDPRAISPAPVPGVPPRAQPTGAQLDRVLAQGYIRIGTGLDSPPFASPGADGSPEGIDVAIAREIARDLFGDPSKAVLVPVLNDDRESALLRGQVDALAETMTVTCDRASRIGFSSIYFEAEQRVLTLAVPLPGRAPITGPADLGGRRVCVTEGSTSLNNVLALAQPPVAIVAQEWNDCLTLLDQGVVDAVSTDHSILDGLQSSDPFTAIVGPGFSAEPYGIGLPPGSDDLARAVNASLERIRRDGTWKRIYDQFLGYRGTTDPPVARYRPGT